MFQRSPYFRYSFWKLIIDWIAATVLFTIFLLPLIVLLAISSINVKGCGIFSQIRVGRFGKNFMIYKLRTINSKGEISSLGRFLRKYKIDELPQLFNIIKGEMSFVGPRPDLPGYYDRLEGDDRCLLNLRPGITSPASIKYRKEEDLLLSVPNPDWHNDHVIFPDKVKLNLEYQKNISFKKDLRVIWLTIRSVF